ncbi:hypothetical protein [Orientia tsutsugamushi]|uniref:Uncharacterized protein n=1 Tax=Orientia tsutsugamushi str. TA716 TaxID=1359175 RepID=A0A0F3P0I1_ORITS|nr:hypothetical protein [Orientia tsutsugamushi]KJV69823.1 hypothetical protein OTSTA716_2785 [Orientia tsutsugamushi str. TA716]KJV73773.1 hypothetical protein OTSTA716_1485 [Orientia tsutsugamushi str. TA716]
MNLIKINESELKMLEHAGNMKEILDKVLEDIENMPDLKVNSVTLLCLNDSRRLIDTLTAELHIKYNIVECIDPWHQLLYMIKHVCGLLRDALAPYKRPEPVLKLTKINKNQMLTVSHAENAVKCLGNIILDLAQSTTIPEPLAKAQENLKFELEKLKYEREKAIERKVLWRKIAETIESARKLIRDCKPPAPDRQEVFCAREYMDAYSTYEAEVLQCREPRSQLLDKCRIDGKSQQSNQPQGRGM